MSKYYIAGLAPCLVLFVIGILFAPGLIYISIFSLPGGLLAGFIGHMVAKKKAMPPPQTYRDVGLSIGIGILIPCVIFYLVVQSCLFC